MGKLALKPHNFPVSLIIPPLCDHFCSSMRGMCTEAAAFAVTYGPIVRDGNGEERDCYRHCKKYRTPNSGPHASSIARVAVACVHLKRKACGRICIADTALEALMHRERVPPSMLWMLAAHEVIPFRTVRTLHV